MMHRGKHGADGHHGSIRQVHFDGRAGHTETDNMGAEHLRHPSDHSNPKSHLHNATRHLTNEEALREKPIESHLPKHSVDHPGV
jgi:hypothetical protein